MLRSREGRRATCDTQRQAAPGHPVTQPAERLGVTGRDPVGDLLQVLAAIPEQSHERFVIAGVQAQDPSRWA